ncbi:UDP-N-acetylmuramate dehydrogenase [Luteimonas sp. M1R5S18]|uniref:UDP-N-acetylenolpyruvoylglucosamine reductase n=1 Tax=Luteimonas rhizosphaericola TaxID=3042024 RepID=A0ABT6JFJ2_9GAMM|nr:UDP-N-acetylmuramate dehydrogenase [Luteimonas rhizosphaericola]MDH5829394.1 UDP-N-acetylmuramate dehydrogenase [Luteimonas rhizosphaericola]
MSDAIRVTRGADLRARNTFGVGARAPLLVEVAALPALGDALAGLPAGAPLLLGGGSNLLFAGDPEAAVLAIRAADVTVLEEDGAQARVRAEAGADWHAFVRRTLELGLCGLENLALIPGTVGAAPIQNIGAYGVEVGEFVDVVEAFEPATGRLHRLSAAQCAFAYRDSLFKREAGRFIVAAVEFRLPRAAAPRIDYAGVREALAADGIDAPTPRQVFDAICALRRRKLPDPAVIGNAGSFFKNPVVPAQQALALADAHPGLAVFPGGDADSRKLSAAWLIDACGWKGHRDGDAGVSAQHALVLVNHGAATGAQLLALARAIAGSVGARFGVALEPEPRIVGASW